MDRPTTPPPPDAGPSALDDLRARIWAISGTAPDGQPGALDSADASRAGEVCSTVAFGVAAFALVAFAVDEPTLPAVVSAVLVVVGFAWSLVELRRPSRRLPVEHGTDEPQEPGA
jgi:hypothetical protein